MSKYYYIAIAIIGGLMIIALTILSQIDKTILNPKTISTDIVKSDLTPQASKQLHRIPFSKSPDDKTSSLVSSNNKSSKDNKTLPSTLLNLRLVGTTVWGEKSSAIIEDLTKGTQGFYRLGDIIKGFKITRISQDSATLTKEDQELVLKLTKGGVPLQAGEFARKTGKNSWSLSADKLTDMVGNINQYAGQIIALQHRENGQPAGFLIRHLKQGNDFEKMGIENGDIIKKVNDLEVNDLSDVLKTIYKLSNDTTFHMEVERNGQPKTLNYQLDKSVNPLVPIVSNMLNIPLGGKKP